MKPAVSHHHTTKSVYCLIETARRGGGSKKGRESRRGLCRGAEKQTAGGSKPPAVQTSALLGFRTHGPGRDTDVHPLLWNSRAARSSKS